MMSRGHRPCISPEDWTVRSQSFLNPHERKREANFCRIELYRFRPWSGQGPCFSLLWKAHGWLEYWQQRLTKAPQKLVPLVLSQPHRWERAAEAVSSFRFSGKILLFEFEIDVLLLMKGLAIEDPNSQKENWFDYRIKSNGHMQLTFSLFFFFFRFSGCIGLSSGFACLCSEICPKERKED